MRRSILAVILVTGIIFAIPVIVYGAFSNFGLASIPGGSPEWFLAGVFVSKLGTASAFVALFVLSPGELGQNWKRYAFIWWSMFACGEVGQAMGPGYLWSEAAAGVISEAIYFPLAAILVSRLALSE
jgi:hypothetical protein